MIFGHTKDLCLVFRDFFRVQRMGNVQQSIDRYLAKYVARFAMLRKDASQEASLSGALSGGCGLLLPCCQVVLVWGGAGPLDRLEKTFLGRGDACRRLPGSLCFIPARTETTFFFQIVTLPER